MNRQTAEPATLPIVSFNDPEAPLSLTYTRDRFTDTHPVVEVSSDLVTWQSGPAFTEDISRLANGDGTETVTTRDLTPRAGALARFVRLRAER